LNQTLERQAMKGSKDSEYSLVSTKNLRQKLALAIGAHSPMNSAPKKLNLPYLWRHSQQVRNPKLERFFLIQTRRLAASVEGLNSSLA